MSWNKFSEKKPTKNKRYLTVTQFKSGNSVHNVYRVTDWANNLRKAYPYDFDSKEYDHEGFWDSDSEWGAYEIHDIVAWKEIEEYTG